MDKTVVIYKSKHGSTKKYAEWIGEELECPVFSADDFSKKELEDYESIYRIYHNRYHNRADKDYCRGRLKLPLCNKTQKSPFSHIFYCVR